MELASKIRARKQFWVASDSERIECWRIGKILEIEVTSITCKDVQGGYKIVPVL